ncbi:MAG: hypothetical protein Q7W53_14585, partial [Pseudomonadota bacterium]|nr:hypothetical protein [Pseudomonadota bacterium]MDP2353989.1 hypothetical protein [Pseudomonadota bacterium]
MLNQQVAVCFLRAFAKGGGHSSPRFHMRYLQNPDTVSDFSHFGANYEVRACHFWQDEVLYKSSNARQMDTIS